MSSRTTHLPSRHRWRTWAFWPKPAVASVPRDVAACGADRGGAVSGTGQGVDRGTAGSEGSGASRRVTATLDVEVTAPSTLELQVAVARLPGLRVEEALTCTLDDEPVRLREVEGEQ